MSYVCVCVDVCKYIFYIYGEPPQKPNHKTSSSQKGKETARHIRKEKTRRWKKKGEESGGMEKKERGEREVKTCSGQAQVVRPRPCCRCWEARTRSRPEEQQHRPGMRTRQSRQWSAHRSPSLRLLHQCSTTNKKLFISNLHYKAKDHLFLVLTLSMM
jgi:hypothetical protein